MSIKMTREQGYKLFGPVEEDDKLTAKQKAAQIRSIINENFHG